MMALEDFKAARSVLAGVLADTHLVHSTALSKATGNQVYIKPENMQVTGAYKIRGAYYKISRSGASSPPPPATTPRAWPTPPRPPG